MRKITVKPRDLEGMVEQSHIPGKNLAKRFADYILPFLDKYDYAGQAKELLKEREILELNVNEAQVVQYLKESEHDYRWLRRAGKLADTTDRATSFLGMLIEATGLASLIGAPGSFVANLGEEFGELLLKVPFMSLLYFDKNNRYRLSGLVGREAATFALPVLGDIYDIFTNIYMKTAQEVIRENAKQRLIAEHGRIIIT